jgi:hypothetical protein
MAFAIVGQTEAIEIWEFYLAFPPIANTWSLAAIKINLQCIKV